MIDNTLMERANEVAENNRWIYIRSICGEDTSDNEEINDNPDKYEAMSKLGAHSFSEAMEAIFKGHDEMFKELTDNGVVKLKLNFEINFEKEYIALDIDVE